MYTWTALLKIWYAQWETQVVVQFWVPLYINRIDYNNIWKHQGQVFWENCVLLRFRFEICEQDLKVRFHNLILGDLLFLIIIYAHREFYKNFKTYLFIFLRNFRPLKLLFTPITLGLDGHLWNCTPHLLLVILASCSRLSLVNGHLFSVLLASNWSMVIFIFSPCSLPLIGHLSLLITYCIGHLSASALLSLYLLLFILLIFPLCTPSFFGNLSPVLFTSYWVICFPVLVTSYKESFSLYSLGNSFW